MAPDDARTILHVDMDAFYVAVELLQRPDLVGKPVVVGGTGARSVVAAASYEARKFGVYSAMSSARARRLCPSAVFLPGQQRIYSEVSSQVHAIFQSISPVVEGIALDEAFLDVTGAGKLFGTGQEIAWIIRNRVKSELGLDCCVGVAPNKFIAKLASKAAKPQIINGEVVSGQSVVVVEKGQEILFLHPLPVKSMWGVGPATLERLERLGIRTIGDLASIDLSVLVNALGVVAGGQLHALAHGVDDRPVVPARAVKSIGHEETFSVDIFDLAELRRHIVRLADAVSQRVRKSQVACRTLTLKIRYANFTDMTRSITPPAAMTTTQGLMDAVDQLLGQVEIGNGVRLVGVSVSNLVEPGRQLAMNLDGGPADTDWVQASEAIDEIRERFGSKAIGLASAIGHGRDLGESPWGPSR